MANKIRQKSLTFTNANYKNRNYTPRPRQSRPRSRTPLRRRSVSRSRSRSRSSNKPKFGAIDGFFHRIFQKMSSLMIDPYTYIGLALMSILMYVHYFHIDDSAVNSIVKTLKKNESTKPLADWLDANINKLFAILMLLYHSIQIPSKYRYFSTLLSMMLILLLPSLSIVTYSATIYGVVIYHKMKKQSDKFVILIVYVALILWFYYDELIKYHTKTTRIKRELNETET